MFSSMPFQEHKKNRARLHSIGVCIRNVQKTHGHIIFSTLPSRPQPALTSKQSPACGVKKGAGGRRPKALKSGHRARRAQGMAVAKRYGGPLSLAAALLNPSQVNLFTQGFP